MQQMMMISQRIVAGGVSATWDSAKKGTDGSLSGGDLIFNNSTPPNSIPSTVLSKTGYTTGKYYYEVLVQSSASQASIGISRAGGATDYNTDLGQEAGEYGWFQNGSSYGAGSFGVVTGTAYNSGDVVGVAIDFGTRRVWFYVNGVLVRTGNPPAGTGQVFTYATGLGTIYAAASIAASSASQQIVGRFTSGSFSYSPPSGFLPWS